MNKDKNQGTLVPPANAGPAFLRWPIVQTIRLQLRFLLPLIAVVIATAWLISLGPIPGIIAVFTAKHVLVAIYVMGIGVDKPREAEISD